MDTRYGHILDKFYKRAYIDDEHKIFCVTEVELGILGYEEYPGDQADFDKLIRSLKKNGYRQHTRLSFKITVSRG